MADVLMVSAFELGHPVLLFILVIADDAFLHTGQVLLRRCNDLGAERQTHELEQRRHVSCSMSSAERACT